MESNYDKYATLDAQIKSLIEHKDKLRDLILAEMIENNKDKIALPFGNFAIAKLKKWVYPAKVTRLKEAFEAEKARSESTGEAEFEEVPSLRFTQAKL